MLHTISTKITERKKPFRREAYMRG